jgi:hypothetical protein
VTRCSISTGLLRLSGRRRADPTHKTVQEVVARAVAEPVAVVNGVGEPREAGSKLYQADDLTILNVIRRRVTRSCRMNTACGR